MASRVVWCAILFPHFHFLVARIAITYLLFPTDRHLETILGRDHEVRGSRINRNAERSFNGASRESIVFERIDGSSVSQRKKKKKVGQLSIVLPFRENHSKYRSILKWRGEGDGASRESNCLFELVHLYRQDYYQQVYKISAKRSKVVASSEAQNSSFL